MASIPPNHVESFHATHFIHKSQGESYLHMTADGQELEVEEILEPSAGPWLGEVSAGAINSPDPHQDVTRQGWNQELDIDLSA